MKRILHSLLRGAAALAMLAPFASAAPVVTATKDDNTAAGVRKVPGNTVTYTTTISNTGDATATAVQFTDPDPANTTFVSINSTPIARNDIYAAIGNVQISIPAGSGLLANDNDPDGVGPALTVTAVNTAGTQGNVTFNADGSFTFNPAAGFAGSTTFTYTISDGESNADTATVTLSVTGTIWFINAAAGAGGDGRLTAPFNTVAAYLASAPTKDAGDNIFLFSGSYATGLTLGASQRLIGQGATQSLATITGLTIPAGSLALPTTGGTRPVIAVAGGTGVILGSGNTVSGLNVTNSNGNGITGTAVGTLTLSDFDVTVTNGSALSLATSGTVTATGSDNDLSATTGAALSVVNVTIGAGGLTFRSISKNGGTSSGIVLSGTGSGTLTVTGTGSAGTGGTLQNISGADAVSLNTVGGLVSLSSMVIQDITASTDATDALQTHSGVDAIHGQSVSGGLMLNGVTIRRISDNAINGTVDGVPVSNNPTFTTWSGLTATNCTFENTNRFNVANRGDATNESAIIIWGVKGTVSVTGCTFTSCSSGLDFITDSAGTLNLTVQGNTFTNLYKEIGTSSIGRFGISLVQRGSLSSLVRIGDPAETNAALGNTFSNGGNTCAVRVVADTGATGSVRATVSRNTSTVTDHSSPGQPPGNTFYNFPQGGVLFRSLGSGNFEAICAANVFNEVMHADGGLGQLTLIAERGACEFIVRNNTFNKPWDLPMEIRADGQSGGQTSCQVLVTGNTHLDGIVGDGTTDLGGQSPYGSSYVQVRNNGRLDLTMQNEATALGLTDTSSTTGTVSLFTQTTTAGDILNLHLLNLQGPRGYRLSHAAGSTFNLFRNGSAAATAQLIMQSNGCRGGAGVDTTNPPAVTATGTITFTNTAPVLPSIVAPLLFAPSGMDPGTGSQPAGQSVVPPASVESSSATPEPPTAVLQQSELGAMVAAAIGHWAATGLSDAQLRTLCALKWEVADLPGWYLGEANGDRIRVDRDAAGNGWHVDGTGSVAAGRIDLLTAVLHEMGHAIGLCDTYAGQNRDHLMYGFLTKGERRLPTRRDAAAATLLGGTAHPHAHFLGAPLTIGDLPVGKTVTITYVVTINAATTAASTSSQGTISGSNIASVLTDDPTVAGAANPTVTPIHQPPVVGNVSRGVNEDAILTFAAADFTPGSYSDPNGDALATARITSLPANGVLKVGATTITAVPVDVAIGSIGTLTFTPDANFNGASSFGWNGSDGTFFATSGATVNLTVNAVNDKPTFAAANPPVVNEDAGAQTVAGWVTSFTPGPANESGQTVLGYTVSSVSNAALFSTPPAVANNGTLTYTPAANANGSSTFQVRVQDSGGTSPGVNLSDAQTFTITVNAVNDAPVITGQAALSTPYTTAKSIALADLTVTDVDNTYPTGFTLAVQNGANYTRSGNTITPVLGFFGTLSVPARVNDGTADSNVFNLAVTVNPDAAFAKAVTGIAPEPGGGNRISFIGNPGQTYTIQFTTSLVTPVNWQPLGTRISGANGRFDIVDIAPPGTPVRFYRAILP